MYISRTILKEEYLNLGIKKTIDKSWEYTTNLCGFNVSDGSIFVWCCSKIVTIVRVACMLLISWVEQVEVSNRRLITIVWNVKSFSMDGYYNK